MSLHIEKAKRNVSRLIGAGALEPDILKYLGSEGLTKDDLLGDAPDQSPSSKIPIKQKFLNPPKGETQLRQDRPIRQAIASVTRPVLEQTGLILGEIAGSPSALVGRPEGIAIGGGLGFVAGRSLADTVEALMQLPNSRTTRDLKQTLSDIPEDFAVGTALSAFGLSTGKFFSGIFDYVFGPSKGILSRPKEVTRTTPSGKRVRIKIKPDTKFNPEKKELMRLADEAGIDLTPAEITGVKGTALFETFLDKLLPSSGALQQRHIETLDKLAGMAERLQKKGADPQLIEIMGNNIIENVNRTLKQSGEIKSAALVTLRDRALKLFGTKQTRVSVGEEAQALLKEKSKEANDVVTDKFKEFWRLLRQDEEIPAPNLEKLAKQYLKEDETAGIGNANLVNLLKKIVGKDGAAPKLPEQTSEMLARQTPETRAALQGLKRTENPPAIAMKLRRGKLNDIIRDEDLAISGGKPGFKGQSSTDAGRAKQLKIALDSDLRAFSESRGGNIIGKFEEANAEAGLFKSIYGSPEMLRIIKSDPAKVMETVIRPGRVNEFRVFSKAIGPEGTQAIRESFVSKVLGEGPEIAGKDVTRQLKRYGDDVLEEVLGKPMLKSLRVIASKQKGVESLELSDPLFRIIARTSPEKVFSSILKQARVQNSASIRATDAGNLARINKIETVIGPEGMESLKASLLEDLFTKHRETGRFLPKKTFDRASSYGERTLEKLFGKEGTEELRSILKLSSAAEGAEKLAGNPSGTSQNLITMSFFGAFVQNAKSFAKSGFGLVLLPKVIAKLYLSPAGRKLLVEGFRTPQGSIRAGVIASQLMAIMGADSLIDPENVTGDPKAPLTPISPFTRGILKQAIDPATQFQRPPQEPVFRQGR